MKMQTFILIFLLLSVTAVTLAFTARPKATVPPGAQAGDLSLRPCKYKTSAGSYRAECGTIIVPENRLLSSSRLLALPVKRIRSASDAPGDPIFYLTGGPGMSNMRFEPPDALLAAHDVVMVGYRGVDGSSVLDCPEYAKASLGDGRDVFSDVSLGMLANAIRACRARTEASGVDWSGYTIQQVVGDLESARVALGLEQIDLLSESYGTRVAQVYAALHPDSLHRSAMIGVNPPGRFVWEPGMVDAQIEYYSRLWEKDEAARLRSANLAESMRNVAHHMPRRWLFFPIDPGKVNTMAFMMLFQRTTSAQVFDAYVAAEHGDASGLALMSMAYDLMVPKAFVWGDFFAKGAGADLDPGRDYTADLRAPGSIIGSPISLLTWSPLSQAWPQDGRPAPSAGVHPTEVETLLVSGSIDFSTPAEYAQKELLPALKKGRQVILSEMGHVGDVWGVQPRATRRLLASFYDTGVADDSLYEYAPVDFRVKFGFPLLAKILLGTGLLFALGLFVALKRLVYVRGTNPK